jgi:hypothetical protein
MYLLKNCKDEKILKEEVIRLANEITRITDHSNNVK